MKTLICLMMLALAGAAWAAKPELPRDGAGQKVQSFAPDGRKSLALTVNSATVDLRNDIGWSVYTPTACKFRAMSTATKAGLQNTLPANANTERRVNSSTPFGNWSGCTSGELQRQ